MCVKSPLKVQHRAQCPATSDENSFFMAKKQLVTSSMILDIDALDQKAGPTFSDRLSILLDELRVESLGKGRTGWLADAAGIRRLAAGNWLKTATPRKTNLQSLCNSICKQFPINVSEEQLYDYLCGKNTQIDIGTELTRAGLTSPEQGHVLTIVTQGMKEKGLDPLDGDNLMLWTKVALRAGRFYINKHVAGNTPTDEVMLATTLAFLELAQNDAI